jgi:hypothetical protein
MKKPAPFGAGFFVSALDAWKTLFSRGGAGTRGKANSKKDLSQRREGAKKCIV